MPRKKADVNPLAGQRVKEALKGHKVNGKQATQEWLSEQLNISTVYLSDIVRGRKRLTPELAMRIAKILYPIRVEWLLCEDDFRTDAERFTYIIEDSSQLSESVDKLIRRLTPIKNYELVLSQDKSTEEYYFAVVESGMVIAHISLNDYCNTRREIIHFSTYLFDNLLAKQKRLLLNPYPLSNEDKNNGTH